VSYQGIALALVATTAYNAGFVLEKRALARLPVVDIRAPLRLLRTLFTAPAWLGGLLCMCVGLGCQLLVLQTLPISLAQPLQVAGIGVLLLLAWLLLGEKVGRRDWWRLAAVAVSVVLLGLSVNGRSQPGTRPPDASGMAAVLGLSAVLAVGMLLAAGRRRRTGESATGVSTGLAAGLLYGIAGLGLKGLSSQVAHHTPVEILALLARSPYLYLVVGASGIGMLVFQTGLQRCRASVVVPTSNIAGSCYVLVLGTWLFHESLPGQPIALALRSAGLAATVLALLIPPGNAGSSAVPGPTAAPPTRQEGNIVALDGRLLDILACPIDKGALLYFVEDGVLYNPRLRRMHRVVADVPLMRADQSDPVDPQRHRQLLTRAAAGAAVGTIGASVAEMLIAES